MNRSRMSSEWCECVDSSDDVFYMPDFSCRCGVDKHHFHCESCLRITQIG